MNVVIQFTCSSVLCFYIFIFIILRSLLKPMRACKGVEVVKRGGCGKGRSRVVRQPCHVLTMVTGQQALHRAAASVCALLYMRTPVAKALRPGRAV